MILRELLGRLLVSVNAPAPMKFVHLKSGENLHRLERNSERSVVLFFLSQREARRNQKRVGSLDLVLRGTSVAMYISGQEETVGESSVSSGCWGEDSNHENGWARHTPTLSRPFAFSAVFSQSYPASQIHCMVECALVVLR